jgi:3-dehydroquinate synthetase
MLMVADKTTQQQIQKQLSARAEARGYLLYDDILALVPEAEQNIELIEEILDGLAQQGVTKNSLISMSWKHSVST